MSLPSDAVKRFILEHHTFLLLGHKEPDGDSVSSQLALAAFLARLGKTARLFCPGPFDRPEIQKYQNRFRERISPADLAGNPAVVILDCAAPDRLDGLMEAVAELPCLVIDHHASGREFGTLRWVDPTSPSVTYLVQHLIEGLGDQPSTEEAGLLLFGLATDTGFFRHLTQGSSQVFAAVSRLVAAGASPNAVYQLIHGGEELAKIKLLAQSLLTVEDHFQGRLLIAHHGWRDLRAGGRSAVRGSEELYRLLQSVDRAEAVVYIREESAGHCSVGLRSKGNVDVGTLAKSLGGGGHSKAAGFSYQGAIQTIKEELLILLGRHSFFCK